MSATVQVVCRLRPLNSKEKRSNTTPVVTASSERKEITLVKGTGKAQVRSSYTFDNVFGSFTTQEEIFQQTLEPVINDVMSGYESTVFAYGQTGTGKTHTMEGDISNPEQWGVIPRSAAAIFERLSDEKIIDSSVFVSYLEIYNEELCDLLLDEGDTGLKLMIAEDKVKGTHCHNLSEEPVSSESDLLDKLRAAQERRKVGETKMNKQSSRSHCLFTLTVRSKEKTSDGMVMERTGKLHMCDLAGSECAKTAGSKGEGAAKERERRNINQSLLTLGRVIGALRDGAQRIPYRDSKLTRLLQESLGGRCKTVIVATISPSVLCSEETHSTLNYAQRAHGIQNKPVSSMRMVMGASAPLCSPSKNAPPNGAQSWQELELKLQYMESEMQEAQTALAKKHAMMQEAVDKVEALEETIVQRDEALEAASAREAEFASRQAALETQLAAREADIKERDMLLVARRETEEKLRSEAASLLQTLDASVADGQRMHAEMTAMVAAEETRRAAARDICEATTSALANLKTDTATFTADATARQEQLNALANSAVDMGKAQVKKVEDGVKELVTVIKATSSTAAANLSERCTAGEGELEAASTSHAAASDQLCTLVQTAKTSMDSCLQELVRGVQAGEIALSMWGEEVTAQLSAAGTRLAGLQSDNAAAVAATQAALATGMAEHTEKLQQQSSALQGLSEALTAHREAEGEHLAKLKSNTALVQASLAEHLQMLVAQQSNLASMLESHRTGQLDAEQLSSLSTISETVCSGAATLGSLLGVQNEGLQNAVLEQTTGNVEEAHVGLLQELQASSEASTEAHVATVQAQHEQLSGALAQLVAGNAEKAHMPKLLAAQQLIDSQSTAQVELLDAQAERLAAQRKKMAAMVQQQAAARSQLIAHVMSSVESLLQEQVGSLGSAFEQEVDALTGDVDTLAEKNTEASEHVIQSRQNYSQASTELQSEAAAWGSENTSVAESIGQVAELELALAAELKQAQLNRTEKNAALVTQSQGWGASNRDVAASMEELTSQNEAINKEVAGTLAAFTPLCEQAQKQAQSWGDSGRATATAMEEISTENSSCQEHTQDLTQQYGAEAALREAESLQQMETTSQTLGRVSEITDANGAAKAQLCASEATVVGGLTDTAAKTVAWGGQQAAVVAQQISQVEQALAARPAVMQQLDLQSSALTGSLEQTTASVHGHCEAQKASLESAIAATNSAWQGFQTRHTAECGEMDQTGEKWNLEVQQIVEHEIERLDAYSDAQQGQAQAATDSAAAHSEQLGKGTEAVSGSVTAFCTDTLEMEQAASMPAPSAELQFSRELSKTPPDDEVLRRHDTARATAPTPLPAAKPSDMREGSDTSAKSTGQQDSDVPHGDIGATGMRVPVARGALSSIASSGSNLPRAPGKLAASKLQRVSNPHIPTRVPKKTVGS